MIDPNELAAEYGARHGHPRMCTPPSAPHPLAEARRIQVRRGQQLPKTAKKVTRPSRWGNPFAVAEHGHVGAVNAYRAWLDGEGPWLIRQGGAVYDRARVLMEASFELAGWDLACACDPGDACHADVLLEVVAEDVRASREALAHTDRHRSAELDPKKPGQVRLGREASENGDAE